MRSAPQHRWSVCALAVALLSTAAHAQVVVSVDRLDGSDPGTPVPANLVVIDVFVDVATTDVWTSSGMRGVTSNGATLVYAGAGGPASLLNPGTANRFVTCLSKPRSRNADGRFTNAGAAIGGSYDPAGPTAVATPAEINALWFASPPESSGSPSFDGYIARVVIDISASPVDPATIVTVASLTPPADTITLFQSRPLSTPLGTVAATFDVAGPTGISWGIYARPAVTGACCTPAGCIVTTSSGCAAAGGAYAGNGTQCAQYAPPVTCAFEDISTTGTLAPTVSSCDNCGEPVQIGFAFAFFQSPHTTVNLCSNGYLTFGSALDDPTNDPSFPNAAAPNDVIAPYWDDWNPAAGGDIYYATRGVAPHRRFIAQWNGVRQGSPSTSATFQALLFETSNTIEFRYAHTNASDSPTIGIEDLSGTSGVNIQPGTQGPCTTIATSSEQGPCADCACDFNGDGRLNSQDFFDFVTCFFTQCP